MYKINAEEILMPLKQIGIIVPITDINWVLTKNTLQWGASLKFLTVTLKAAFWKFQILKSESLPNGSPLHVIIRPPSSSGEKGDLSSQYCEH